MWDSFGKFAQIVDFASEYGEVSARYDLKTNQVYEIIVEDVAKRYPIYRWVDPEYIKAYIAEHRARGVQYYSDYTDTDCDEDILDKAVAIVNNRSFDPSVIFSVELPVDVIAAMEDKAWKDKVTIDEIFTQILEDIIEKNKDALQSDY